MNISNLEKKYPILEEIEEWNFIRNYMRSRLIIKNFSGLKRNSFFDKLKNLKNVFFGFKNWFNTYEYLFFSDSGERKFINKKYFDKYMDDFIDKLEKKSLLIELPNPNHYLNSYTKYIVSEIPINIAGFIIKKFIRAKNLNKLDEILKKEKLNINYKNYIIDFKAKYLVYKFLLTIYHPKKIFVNCYYCRQTLVKAAHALNIEVVEFQHGTIYNHESYISPLNLNKNYFSDILLSLGEGEKDIKNLIIPNVIPLGSFYLNYIRKNLSKIDYFENLRKKYNTLIAFSMQDINEEIYQKIFNYLNEIAKKDKKICIFIIPRHKKDFDIKLAENIKVIKNYNCYEVVFNSDIHSTIYSSCVLESPYLGKPNILININNMSYKFFGNIFPNVYSKIVNTPNEFLISLEKLKLLNKTEIIRAHKKYIVNYDENIKKVLHQIKGI